MTFREIREYRTQLIEIQKKTDEQERLEALKTLAPKVGGSVIRMGKILTRPNFYGRHDYDDLNLITETEIVQNINDALRTESMINTYKWVMITAIAATGSAIAACIAMLITWKCGK